MIGELELRESELRVVLTDGETLAIPYSRLRAGCRCAACEALRRTGASPAVAMGVTVTAVQQVGYRAVNFRFSDGHAGGIYPFVYLEVLARRVGP